MSRKKAKDETNPEPRETAKEPATLNDVPTSSCGKCGSTRRTDYHHIVRLPHPGPAPDGTPCDTVILRRTECEDCGQQRVDRSYELAGS